MFLYPEACKCLLFFTIIHIYEPISSLCATGLNDLSVAQWLARPSHDPRDTSSTPAADAVYFCVFCVDVNTFAEFIPFIRIMQSSNSSFE